MKDPSAERADLQVGTLDQIPNFEQDTTVLEEGLRAFDDLIAAEREMERLEHEISRTSSEDLLDRYSALQQTSSSSTGGYKVPLQWQRQPFWEWGLPGEALHSAQQPSFRR